MAERPAAIVVATLVLLGALNGEAGALDKRRAEQALAKITVLEGATPKGRATGFAWHQKDWVVTSLHAMRVGATYQVERPAEPGRVWAAVVIANLPDHDLVLLELRSRGKRLTEAQKPGWTPFTDAHVGAQPGSGREIYALGYYSDTPEPRLIELKVESSRPLEKKIPSAHADKIRSGKIPNVALPVLHFMTASLLPGYSGAPLFDESGQLVGIGNGGLENGAIDISWGVHAVHLGRLATAKGPLPTTLTVAREHYSADLAPARRDVGSIPVGEYEFVYKKTRSFTELRETVDNPRDFENLMSDIPLVDISALRFDIYQDLNYGLVVAVPEGSRLGPDPEFDDAAAVQLGSTGIRYTSGAHAELLREVLASPEPVKTIAELFLDDFADPENYELDDDASFCQRSLEGGLMAVAAFETPTGLLYNKLAVKGELMLAAAADFAPDARTLARYSEAELESCLEKPVDCGSVSRDDPCSVTCTYVQAVTAVYLTSFSNFQATGEGCALADAPAVFTATDRTTTVHGVIDWASFDSNAIQLVEQGLYLRDLEVLAEGGQWMLGGVHQTLPLPTFWRYGMDLMTFNSETQALAQQGYQLKDLEVSWDGDWKYAGVFQADYRTTAFVSYANSDQLAVGLQQYQQAGWNLIDIEVPWGPSGFFIVALYQYAADASTYRFGSGGDWWDQVQSMARQGWNLFDVETYFIGQVQWFAGVFSPAASPAYTWAADWNGFENQARLYKSQGYYLDDLEVFYWNGQRWAIGVFH